MRKNPPSVALYKYKVPQSFLTYFFTEIQKDELNNEIVDIEKYISEDLA